MRFYVFSNGLLACGNVSKLEARSYALVLAQLGNSVKVYRLQAGRLLEVSPFELGLRSEQLPSAVGCSEREIAVTKC